MRIGIVTQSYFPIRGGVAEHVYHTAVELEARGHDVTIITANFSRFDDDRGRKVVRIGHDITVPYNGAFVNLTVGFRLARRLRAIEAEHHFDVVHIHGPLEPLLPLVALKSISCPKVGTFHSFNSGTPLGYQLMNRQLNKIAGRLAARIAVSNAARLFISRFVPGHYDIIPNGVNCERFRPDISVLPEYANREEFNILFVGRLDPRKGVKYLIRAFSIIASELPKARLTIVGNGMLRPYYQGFVAPELKDRVKFVGFVSADDLPHYYASCDVFCSPAVGGESFGIVLVEALAAGKPVVASDIEGYRDVIRNGREGVLVERRRPVEIARAILDIARRPERRQEIAQSGRERALEFSWHRVAEKIEAVYRRVTDG